MKRLSLFLLACATGAFSFAQCSFNEGNYPPPYNQTGSYSPGYLLGTKQTVVTGGTLTGLAFKGMGTNSGIMMALYTNVNNAPGTLIAWGQSTVGTGNITITVTSTSVGPGDYWLMACYQNSANHVEKTTSSSKTVHYISHNYGNTPPSTFGAGTTYNGQDFNYWMVFSGQVNITASQTNISCNGGANGMASVTASSGTIPYTYSWSSGGATTSSISSLSGGTYTCTVTDSKGCTKTQTVNVSEPAPISTAASVDANVSCFGGTNGSASVSANGGTGSYTYSWAPGGGSTALLTTLSAGTYTCTVTDANGCTKMQTVSITEPSQVLAMDTAATICTGNSITINSSATGGTGSYTYSWNPGGATTSSITVNPTATTIYTLTVTDANGCSYQAQDSVGVDPCAGIIDRSNSSGISVHPNPTASGHFVVEISGEGNMQIMNTLGEVILTAPINNRKEADISHFAKGVYFIRIVSGDRPSTIELIYH